MARTPSRAPRTRKPSKGGAINRASIQGTARGDRPTPNQIRATRRQGSGAQKSRRNQSDEPAREFDPARYSTRPMRRVLANTKSTSTPNRSRDSTRSRRKSGGNDGRRFEYDERDFPDSAAPAGWSGMDEERQKRPPSRESEEHDHGWSRTNAGQIDNDHEETTAHAPSHPGRARADAGDHATPARGKYSSTEAHATGAAARGCRGHGGVVPSARRGRAGRPRGDW